MVKINQALPAIVACRDQVWQCLISGSGSLAKNLLHSLYCTVWWQFVWSRWSVLSVSTCCGSDLCGKCFSAHLCFITGSVAETRKFTVPCKGSTMNRLRFDVGTGAGSTLNVDNSGVWRSFLCLSYSVLNVPCCVFIVNKQSFVYI